MSKFCKNCGNELMDAAVICPKCGIYQENNNTINSNTNKSNVFAIIGFISSFFITILGLIFSIVGLVKAKKVNNGKGLAIAGIIISSIKIVIIILIVVIILLAVPSVKTSIDTAKQKQFENAIEAVEEYMQKQIDVCNIGDISLATYDNDIFDDEGSCKFKTDSETIEKIFINSGYTYSSSCINSTSSFCNVYIDETGKIISAHSSENSIFGEQSYY